MATTCDGEAAVQGRHACPPSSRRVQREHAGAVRCMTAFTRPLCVPLRPFCTTKGFVGVSPHQAQGSVPGTGGVPEPRLA